MDRPWVDARTYRREFKVRELTAKDVIEAMEKMEKIPPRDYYIFLTEWVKPYVSEEECIKYFADNRDVVVYDSKGRFWRRGEMIPDSTIK